MPGSPEELKRHDCINVVLPNGAHARWTFVDLNASRRSRRHVSFGAQRPRDEPRRADAVHDAALAGLGITVISIENVLGPLRDGSLVRVLPNYEIDRTE